MKKFWIDCTLVSLFVFGVLVGLYSIFQLNIFSAFDPVGKAFGDMELSDIAISRLRVDPPIDTNIVVVNVGELTRGEIGSQIMMISRFQPKVIGFDILFSCDQLNDTLLCPQALDTLGNLMFSNAIREALDRGVKVVMAHKIHQSKKLVETYGDIDLYDSLEHTNQNLRLEADEGFVNLDTDAEHQEDLKSCRRFFPEVRVGEQDELAYSVRIAMLYDSVKTKKFLSRNKKSEIINYRGNIMDPYGASGFAGRYYTLDWDQALDPEMFAPFLFKDKIVILGFLGENLNDTSWDDKFFTPLNKNYAGKTRPDMYGVVVHANIISMILNEDYVEELQQWQEFVFAFVIVMLTVALFFKINNKWPVWFDTLSLLIQVAQVVVLSFFMIFFFKWFSFKLNLTVTLALVAIVGTCFEIYNDLVSKVVNTIRTRVFTKKRAEVLNP